MNFKLALSSLSKASVVDQGYGKGKELGKEVRTYAETAKGGRADSSVVVHDGLGHLLASKKWRK